MRTWKKWVFIALLICVCFMHSTTVHAEINNNMGSTDTIDPANKNKQVEKIQDKKVTDDPVSVYRDYENFSFPLMTKEPGSLNPVTKTIANMGVGIKAGTWEATKFVGLLNAKATGFLFDLDAMKPIRQPILNLTNGLADSLIGIATTLGVMALALIMLIKFVMEQNLKQALLVFIMAVLVIASMLAMSDPNKSKAIMTVATDLDTAVAGAFMNSNKALENSDEYAKKSPGEKVEANIFKANVFTPYLINNYGISDVNEINKKKIKYNSKEYSRLGLLMGNADSSTVSEDFVSDVAKIEYDDLKNKNVGVKKSMSIAIINIFFLLLNLIQFIIYFLLFLLKGMLGFLLLFMFPLSIFILLFSMFSSQINPFKNIAKGYLTVMLLKGGVSFIAFFFATYMLIAYRTSDDYNNIFLKIIVILFYVLLPLILYIWRTLILNLLIAAVTGNSVAPHRLANQLVHPVQSANEAKLARKERRREREKEKENGGGKREEEKQKSKTNSLGNVIKVPQKLVQKANEARKGQQEKRKEQRKAQKESEERVQSSEARRGAKRAEEAKEKEYEKVFGHVPVGEGRNGELSERQQRVQGKREQIQQKHRQRRQAKNTAEHNTATATRLSNKRQANQEKAYGRTGQATKKNPPLKKGNVQPATQKQPNHAANPTPKTRKAPPTRPIKNSQASAVAARPVRKKEHGVAKKVVPKPVTSQGKRNNPVSVSGTERKQTTRNNVRKVAVQRPVTSIKNRPFVPTQRNRRK